MIDKLQNISEVIHTTSSYKSYRTDLGKTADQLWSALLSCKKFLSKSLTLPDAQYFFNFKDKSDWEYYVPDPLYSLKEEKRNFQSAIFFKPNFPSQKKSYLNLKAGTNQKVLTINEDDLRRPEFISDISKVYKSNSKLLKASIILSLYLPFIIGEWRAKQNSKIFVTGHLTQSKDGKISRKGGEPVWLGGEEDKKHTHRLRSLHQALLIGSNTIAKDNPQLTVRYCRGQDPVPVVFFNDKGNIFNKKVFKEKNRKVIVISKIPEDQNLKLKNERLNISIINFPLNDGIINPSDLLSKLRDLNISSIFIEGGGITISHFLLSKSLNRFHLHVSSKILGEGVDSFKLPKLSSINQIPSYKRVDHKISDQILMDFIPIQET